MGSKENDTIGISLEKVNEISPYIVFIKDDGYILYNSEKEFIEGHTHLKSLKMAKDIINNCKLKKKPKGSNMYLLISHTKVSNDATYINYIKSLIDVKKSKGNRNYCNSKSRVRK